MVLGPVRRDRDLSRADCKIVGAAIDDYAGYSVAGAGDTNGDGNDDVLVGALLDDEGGDAAGAAALILGPASGTIDLAAADARLLGEDAVDTASVVAGAGDVDGDGNMDVLVGAPNRGSDDAGTAYLVLGPVSGTWSLAIADARFPGEAADDMAGAGVAGAGDVDADGHDDVLVGAWGHDAGGDFAGAAYLFFGPTSGTRGLGTADAKLVGEGVSAGAGAAVDGAGDVDADGHADLLVGSHPYQNMLGAAYLVLGPVSGEHSLATAHAKLVGELAYDHVGISVAGAGDVDGDGHDDLLVGSQRHTLTDPRGAAYVVYGPVSGTLDVLHADVELVETPARTRVRAWRARAMSMATDWTMCWSGRRSRTRGRAPRSSSTARGCDAARPRSRSPMRRERLVVVRGAPRRAA